MCVAFWQTLPVVTAKYIKRISISDHCMFTASKQLVSERYMRISKVLFNHHTLDQ